MASEFNLAPRKITQATIGLETGNLMLIDTEREKEIYLGVGWPFEPLGLGQCLLAAEVGVLWNVHKNDVVNLTMDLTLQLNAMIGVFNKENEFHPFKQIRPFNNASVQVPCTVTDFMASSYEKFPPSD